MEEVKRTNIVMIRNSSQEQAGRGEKIKRYPYMIDVDRRRNRYSCGYFGHFAWNCRSCRIVGKERRISHGNNKNILNNLKKKENLVVFD